MVNSKKLFIYRVKNDKIKKIIRFYEKLISIILKINRFIE